MAQEPGRGPGTLKSWHGRQAARAIFDMKPRPSAVVCDNGPVAFGVPHELGRMGKRAGKALAIAGCDNVVAPLTALSAGAEKIGAIASETLLARLGSATDEARTPARYVAIPGLIVRESSVGPASRHR
jgi:LacI family transcriptional regulator